MERSSGSRAALIAVCVAVATSAAPQPRDVESPRRVSFDNDWRFQKGDPAGAERVDFKDDDWRRLDVPHDWAIEGPFDEKFGPPRGALPFFGVAWYRKHFVIPGAAGRFYSVEFDGAMSNARVFLNGRELGARRYGYIGFSFDLTPHLRTGPEGNVLAVRLAPEDQSSRWYPGAGLYRHVWLDNTGPVHVARWGTYVTTPSVSDAKATVRVRTEIQNRNAAAADVTLETTVRDPAGREVARTSVEQQSVKGGASGFVEVSLDVDKPQRWDIDRPQLYEVISAIRQGNRVVDRYSTPFGIRTIEFSAARGFQLNGRRVPIQGVCMHHDLGALGTAIYERALERQLEILKAMGANAIRTSHNPPAPELLDLADRMGFLVLDEAFDEWRRPKVKNGHGVYFDQWGERDLRDMIRRDRNHPSVVLWSIGNEVLEQDEPEGWKLTRHLKSIAHEEDPTRLVTAGFNQIDNVLKNKIVDELDVKGFNYGPRRYATIAKEHPDWIILGAETSSMVSSRGAYHLPLEKYKKHPSHDISSYDIITPRWGYAPDVEFDAIEKAPNVVGEFVWTGFDYLGEPTPYWMWNEPRDPSDWPARSSYFGIIDLAGFPKDRYYLYQSRWTRTPMVHLLPHWNWAGREGQAIPVFVYTNAPEAELFLNGKSLGRKRRGVDRVELPVGPNVDESLSFTSPYRLQWSVPWKAGTLRVAAIDNGKTVASKEVRTAGNAAKVALVPDRAQIHGDGRDLSFVAVRIEDADGNLCPLADNLVQFTVSGPGRIVGLDNGNAATVEPFQGDRRHAYHGLASVIVRADYGRPGTIRLAATSAGLQSAETSIMVGQPFRAAEFDRARALPHN